MSGIKPARNTNYEMFTARGLKASRQPLHLDIERFVTIVIKLLVPIGHIGEAPERALQANVGKMWFVLKPHGAKTCFRVTSRAGTIVERAIAHALEAKALH